MIALGDGQPIFAATPPATARDRGRTPRLSLKLPGLGGRGDGSSAAGEAARLDDGPAAELAGLLHDLGKYRDPSQEYLSSKRAGSIETHHAVYDAALAFCRKPRTLQDERLGTVVDGRGCLMRNPMALRKILASIIASVWLPLDGSGTLYGQPVEEGKIYWTEARDLGWIQRSNLDGSNLESLLTTDIVAELKINPRRIALAGGSGWVSCARRSSWGWQIWRGMWSDGGHRGAMSNRWGTVFQCRTRASACTLFGSLFSTFRRR